MHLIARLRHDESGSVLVIAFLSTMIMLALGLALLAIVDTQASQSGTERTRDRAFNLSESVLSSEAFVLGRNWPLLAPATPDPICNTAAASFGDSVGATTDAPGASAAQIAATTRLRTTINSSYTDSAYSSAPWQVNICDDDSTSTVWSESLLTTQKSWDVNANNKVWVRAQSTISGKTRVVVGLVQARQLPAVNSKFGLVAGSVKQDLAATTSLITNATVLSGVTGSGLLNTNPVVAPDTPTYPVPASGVTGLRCGLFSGTPLRQTCITGALSALSAIPAFDALVTGGAYTQYPSVTSSEAGSAGQLRAQAIASGTYKAQSQGGPISAPLACQIPGTPDANTVVFIEKVGTGDEYCTLDVSASKAYKALVIGSGRVIIRGNNTITAYSDATTNLFTGVVYALNLQTSDLTASTPTRELVRVDRGARVKGAVHADGKNASVNLLPPPFSTNSLVDGLLCPGLLCASAGVIKALPAGTIVDTLINGGCVGVVAFGACVGVQLTPIPALTVLANITSQLSTYGSAIHSNVAVIDAVKVYGASGVVPGTFRDIYPR
jgi:Tfp pilus assembly protein PilX